MQAIDRNLLVSHLDELLNIDTIRDYGPQGLQLESANDQIRRVALAVDVAPPIIAAAAAWKADLLLVHHGILWRAVEPLTGALGRRVRDLLSASINLYAAHLPLDAHPQYGNNAVLADMLDLRRRSWWGRVNDTPLGVVGDLPLPQSLSKLTATIEGQLNTTVRLLAHGAAEARRVAILSGAGADRVHEARAMGADTYLTGETSHAHYWAAADQEMNVIFAGHYATETVGVQALGRYLNAQFGVVVRFFDYPTQM